jgi:hypothetical protein
MKLITHYTTGMLTDILKNKMFNLVFSFALGVGIAAIFRPICQGGSCNVVKAPPTSDWDGYVYRMGAKCYEYKSEIVQCPKEGFIEGFGSDFASRPSSI